MVASFRTSFARPLADEDITIFGEGNQTRSFCYRDDLVNAIIAMMNNDQGFIGPVNIGNPVEFTIRRACRTGDRARPVLQQAGLSAAAR